ncbi:hypothetical protein [Blastochloris sulfoviridis]|nr:hypothetical protein [Blastochloris sulfoviridis]
MSAGGNSLPPPRREIRLIEPAFRVLLAEIRFRTRISGEAVSGIAM